MSNEYEGWAADLAIDRALDKAKELGKINDNRFINLLIEQEHQKILEKDIVYKENKNYG